MSLSKSRALRAVGLVFFAAMVAALVWVVQQFVKEQRALAHIDSATALMGQDQLQPAEHHLKQALALDSDSSGAHLRLGSLYLKQRQLPLAQQHLEKAHQLSPEDVNIINNLGTIFEQLGKYQKAIEEFKQAIQLMPGKAGGYNNLAWLYATCQDNKFRNTEKALSLANKACELTGWNNSSTLDTLATANAETGNFKEAVRWQTKAVEFAPATQKVALQRRLESYRQGKSYLTPAQK
jgi:Flp pilus assembly protein TadD